MEIFNNVLPIKIFSSFKYYIQSPMLYRLLTSKHGLRILFFEQSSTIGPILCDLNLVNVFTFRTNKISLKFLIRKATTYKEKILKYNK